MTEHRAKREGVQRENKENREIEYRAKTELGRTERRRADGVQREKRERKTDLKEKSSITSVLTAQPPVTGTWATSPLVP